MTSFILHSSVEFWMCEIRTSPLQPIRARAAWHAEELFYVVNDGIDLEVDVA